MLASLLITAFQINTQTVFTNCFKLIQFLLQLQDVDTIAMTITDLLIETIDINHTTIVVTTMTAVVVVVVIVTMIVTMIVEVGVVVGVTTTVETIAMTIVEMIVTMIAEVVVVVLGRHLLIPLLLIIKTTEEAVDKVVVVVVVITTDIRSKVNSNSNLRHRSKTLLIAVVAEVAVVIRI